MSIETTVNNELKRYNFELTDLGVQAIIIQIKLLYGNKPSVKQVREVIKNNKISFINEHKKVIKNDINR